MRFSAAYDLQTDSNDLENSPVNWCVRKELEGGDSVPIIEIYPDPFDVQDQESPEHDQEYKDTEKIAKVCADGDRKYMSFLHQRGDGSVPKTPPKFGDVVGREIDAFWREPKEPKKEKICTTE